jgi:hypothetical protein
MSVFEPEYRSRKKAEAVVLEGKGGDCQGDFLGGHQKEGKRSLSSLKCRKCIIMIHFILLKPRGKRTTADISPSTCPAESPRSAG